MLEQLEKYFGQNDGSKKILHDGVVIGSEQNYNSSEIQDSNEQNLEDQYDTEAIRSVVKKFDGDEIAVLLKQVEEELKSRVDQNNQSDTMNETVGRVKLLQE